MAWNLAVAAHLFRRTGFGANWRQLQDALSDGQARTVRGIARAFTGWFVLRDEVRYLPDQHDPGAPSSEEALRSLLANPATARRVVGKLYRWLVAETHPPDEALAARLSESFARDWDIR